jgi:hypothetical protein
MSTHLDSRLSKQHFLLCTCVYIKPYYIHVITMGTYDWHVCVYIYKRPRLDSLYLFCLYVAVSLVGSYR